MERSLGSARGARGAEAAAVVMAAASAPPLRTARANPGNPLSSGTAAAEHDMPALRPRAVVDRDLQRHAHRLRDEHEARPERDRIAVDLADGPPRAARAERDRTVPVP